MFILGFRNNIDRKYYIPTYVQPPNGSGFRVNLLVDTGAARTAIVANEAFYLGGIIATTLPLSNSYEGIGEGSVQSYKLENTTLRFATSVGPYDVIMDLEILLSSNSGLSSILGMEILGEFDIMPEDRFTVVLRKRTDPLNDVIARA